MMRVVYLNPGGQMGGAEVALLEMLRGLKEARPQWTLSLVLAGDGPLAAKARTLGVAATILRFPASLARLGDAGAGGPAGAMLTKTSLFRELVLAGPAILSYASQLKKLLRELNPDIVHTTGFKMHLLGALARLPEVPLVWHVHDYVRQRPFMARLMKLYQKRCAIILTNSNSVAQDVTALCDQRLPVQTVYNSVDTATFCPDGPRLDLDALSGLPTSASDTVKVGLLATLARWKGHEVFLRAISLLPPDLAVRGYVIGGALYETVGSQHSLAELKALADELGVSHRVGFTGFVDQPAAAMRSLDIVVHASTEPEPFGLVIAEGMACGRAVIAGESGGAAEIVDAGVNALTHHRGDASHLAQQIMLLAGDAELRSRLGSAGRESVMHRFDRQRQSKEVVAVYSRLVQKPIAETHELFSPTAHPPNADAQRP